MLDNVKRACLSAVGLLTWHFRHSNNNFTSVCTSAERIDKWLSKIILKKGTLIWKKNLWLAYPRNGCRAKEPPDSEVSRSSQFTNFMTPILQPLYCLLCNCISLLLWKYVFLMDINISKDCKFLDLVRLCNALS